MKSEIRNPKSETSPKGQIQNPKDEGDALPWSLELRHSDLLRNSGFGIRAFSLIEVLVVVAIIIILVGLALAGINLAYQRSEESAAKGIVATLAGVEKEYRAQTGQSLPTSANGDLAIDNGILQIVQDNSSVAAEMLLRIPTTNRSSGTINGSNYDVAVVKDPWGTRIFFNDGSGDANSQTTYGMPKQTYPFFASAGPDGGADDAAPYKGFGRWDHSTNAPTLTGTNADLNSDSVPDAKDNLYSFEVK